MDGHQVRYRHETNWGSDWSYLALSILMAFDISPVWSKVNIKSASCFEQNGYLSSQSKLEAAFWFTLIRSVRPGQIQPLFTVHKDQRG
jgi:hypothetical protein